MTSVSVRQKTKNVYPSVPSLPTRKTFPNFSPPVRRALNCHFCILFLLHREKTLPHLTKLDNAAVTEDDHASCSKYSDHELLNSEAAQNAYSAY